MCKPSLHHFYYGLHMLLLLDVLILHLVSIILALSSLHPLTFRSTENALDIILHHITTGRHIYFIPFIYECSYFILESLTETVTSLSMLIGIGCTF